MNGINNLTINELIRQGIGDPKILPLNLAIPLNDERFPMTGSQIGLWEAPNQSDVIWVRFNEVTRQQIPFKRGKLLRAPFKELYITVPAGLAGNAYFLYGTGEEDIFKIQPNVTDPLDILNELEGDLVPENWGNVAVGVVAVQVIAANANRKSFHVQAALGNTQTVWIGYTNLVTNLNAAAALVAGQAFWLDDYRGAVYAIAGGAGQVVHYSEV